MKLATLLIINISDIFLCIVQIGRSRNTHGGDKKCVVEKPEGERDHSEHLGVKGEDNITGDIKERVRNFVDWIHMTQYRDR